MRFEHFCSVSAWGIYQRTSAQAGVTVKALVGLRSQACDSCPVLQIKSDSLELSILKNIVMSNHIP